MNKHFFENSDQISFESLLTIADFFDSDRNVPTIKEQIVSPAENYLQKGERLLSLAREKYRKALAELKISTFEEALYNVDSKNDIVTDITNRVIRPILRKAEMNELSNPESLIAEMVKFIEFDISLSEVAEGEARDPKIYLRNQLKSDSLIKLCIKETGYPDLVVYGLKCHAHPANKKNVLFKSGSCVADIALTLSWLILASVFKKALSDSKSDSFRDAQNSDAAKETRKNYVGFSFCGISQYEIISKLRNNAKIDIKRYVQEMDDIFNHPWYVPAEEGCIHQYEILQPILERNHVTVEKKQADYQNLVLANAKLVKHPDLVAPHEIPIIVSHNMAKMMWRRDVYEFMEVFPHEFKYHFLLQEGAANSWAVPSWNSGDLQYLLKNVFLAEYRQKHTQVSAIKNLKDLETSHARSFQTKKNIPKKTLAAMEESIFNDYFGYVEFDEDVDLAKADTIAKQFVAFKETYLPKIDSSLNAIRFRKLGNHKAIGLYYPSVKCLCVDINSPSSLLHEYGHLIDYCYGNLSISPEFYDIKRIYEKRLVDAMAKDNVLNGKMNGKGKYNLSYYLLPTEIFARTFEIYIKEVLKVDNSLTPSADGAVYPKDDAFIQMVSSYFETTLPLLGKEENKEAAHDLVAANKK